jgi:phosphoglycolate phosphatase
MTHVHNWRGLQAQLKKAKLILLDFDGPICSIFEGFPAEQVAERLRDFVRNEHSGPMSELDQTGSDPFDVLAYVKAYSPEKVRAVEAHLTRLECEAVELARPTAGFLEFIKSPEISAPLGVVSNNSTRAVEEYLRIHDLAARFSHIAGRSSEMVEKLKPAPDLLLKSLKKFQVEASEAVFIGDSLSDMIAGRSAGTICVAFANRTWKRELLGEVCDVLIEKYGK